MEWTAKAQEWKRIFEAFDAGGITRKVFCGERGIKLTTFDYWRHRLLRTEGEEATVVKVGAVAQAVVKSVIRVRLDDRLVVELDGLGFHGLDEDRWWWLSGVCRCQ